MKPSRTVKVRRAVVLFALCIYASVAWLHCWTGGERVARASAIVRVDDPDYVACQLFNETQASRLGSPVASGPDMTVASCRSACDGIGYYYALLQGGRNCYCSNEGHYDLVLPDSSCSTPCPSDRLARCGGERALSVYVVRTPDGDRDWSPWMRLEGSSLRSRYRGCARPKVDEARNELSCLATIEKNYTGPATSGGGLADYFIGCFTMVGLQSLTKFTPSQTWPTPAHQCIAVCKHRKQTYAALLTSGTSRTCACASDLGSSVPADTCAEHYGAQVFNTTKGTSGSVTLKFVGTAPAAQQQRKALLLGYFRGGTTFVASALSHYPNAFYTYEPDALLGIVWPGVDSFGDATDMALTLVDKVLTPYFRCDFHRLPGLFGRWYPQWGEDNQGYGPYLRCTARYESADEAAAKCRPVLEESCQRAPLLVAKTTRLLNAVAIKRLIDTNDGLHVIHLIRDPRATLSSRKNLLSFYGQRFDHHAAVLCNEIVTVDRLLKTNNASGLLLTTYYERFATQPFKAASDLYRSLGTSLPREVSQHLASITSASGASAADVSYAFGIKRKNSAAHVARYRSSYDAVTLQLIDAQCTALYSGIGRESGLYEPLAAMPTSSR